MSTLEILSAKLSLTKDPQDQWGDCFIVKREDLMTAVEALRDSPELRCNMLLDILGIDYLMHPKHQGPRFAVVYVFKSTIQPALRCKLKVLVDEEDAVVPSIHAFYLNANWLERETWDQYGIRFEGHPNLKRLLNHVEFVGHPLRKDYPATKRQWLSTNDPMTDQLEARLKEKGFTLLEPMPIDIPAVEDLIQGDRT